MQNRSPVAVFFLSLITLGIYGIVWQVKTKGELNRLGADIPTAWLLIVPFVNWWWLWKYSEGVEKVTGGRTSGILAFLLLFLLGIIGMAVLQNEFNKVASGTPVAQAASGQGSVSSVGAGSQPEANSGNSTDASTVTSAPLPPKSSSASDQTTPPDQSQPPQVG